MEKIEKNKAAVVSLFVLIIMIILTVAAPIVAPHDPNVQTVEFASLPPKIPGIGIDGLNGTQKVGENRVDKYAEKMFQKINTIF